MISTSLLEDWNQEFAYFIVAKDTWLVAVCTKEQSQACLENSGLIGEVKPANEWVSQHGMDGKLWYNDQRWVQSWSFYIPCQWSCWGGGVGVYWFHHGCLSVEKGFLHDNTFSFWPTMMILHTCVDHDPRRTSLDFEVKRSRSNRTSNFLSFPHDTSISFWHALMIPPTYHMSYVDHDPKRTFIDFGIKAQGHDWFLNFVPFLHNNSFYFWHTMIILDIFLTILVTQGDWFSGQ